MIIDGQNNLHMRNTHIIEDTKFCKILQFERECKRDIGRGRERERERERENSNVKHAKSFVLKRKKKWNSNVQHFNLLT